MASLNPFRRKFRTLIAAGKKVDLSKQNAVANILRRRELWQEQSWNTYDAVGEVKYGVNYIAFLSSRVILYVGTQPEQLDAAPSRLGVDDNGEPVDLTGDDKLAVDTLDRLGAPVTRADKQREMAVCLLVPGEYYLICIGARGDTPEKWLVRSQDEVITEGDNTYVIDPDTDEKVLLDSTQGDTFIRIWRQHAKRHHYADSHVRGILEPAEELLWWDAAAVARAKQRLGDSGAVLVPSDMETVEQSEEDAQLSGAARTAKRLQEAAMVPIKNPGAPEAASPIFATYPANEQRKSGLEHITFDRPQDQLLEKRTDRCLQRIAQGLNVPVEIISGLSQAAHWGGGAIEEAVFREHVEPIVILICAALTQSFLHPILEEEGVTDFDKYVIWYDASNLVVHPDMGQAADRGVELGAISRAAWRRMRGIPERDKPSDEEAAAILEWLQATRSGQGGLNENQGVVKNPQKPSQPHDPNAPPGGPEGRNPSEHPPVDQPAGPLRGPGQKPIAASLNGTFDVFAARIEALADERIRRALEKAGNQLRSRANKVSSYKQSLRGVKPEYVAATLGKEAATKLGIDDLFSDSFESVPSRIAFLCERAGYDPDQSRSVGYAIKDELTLLACQRLFSPPTDEPLVQPGTLHDLLNVS